MRLYGAGPTSLARPLLRTFAGGGIGPIACGTWMRWQENVHVAGRRQGGRSLGRQKRRNKKAALKLPRKLLKNQSFVPGAIVTDDLASYKAALRELSALARHQPSRLHENIRAENSHLPIRRRERRMQMFKPQGQTQRFVSTHSAIYNTFNTERHLVSRKTMRKYRDRAFAEWQAASASVD